MTSSINEQDNLSANTLQEQHPEIIIECDRRMTVTLVNPAFLSITGLEASACLGQKLLDLVRREDQDAFSLSFDRALLKRESRSSVTFALRAGDGSFVWLEGRVQALREGGAHTRIHYTLNDFTARKLLQDELKRTKSVLQTIIEQSRIGYVFLAPDLRIVTFNESAEKRFWLQFKKPPVAGVSMIDYMPEERKAGMRELYLDTLQGKNSNYHISFTGADGHFRYYFGNVFPVYTEDQQLLGIIHSSEDITERKKAEQQREQANMELNQQNRHLEQITHIISHNLLSPISQISELARLLRNRESLSKEDLEMCLNGLQVSASRIDQTVNDLNTLLQQRNEAKDKRSLVRFGEVLKEVLSWLPESGSDHDVELSQRFEVSEYLCNPIYMQSIFHNLISNSLKYRKSAGPLHIVVSTSRKNDRLLLNFTDNGQGINMDKYADKVFGLYEKFHPHVDGKGMGLYMVKTQTELMGGSISLDSKTGEGCSFTLSFPYSGN